MDDHDYVFKVIIVGETGVGKTSLLMRFIKDEVDFNQAATIGVDFKVKTIEVDIHGVTKRVKLMLWDTAGQERFNAVTQHYFRGSHGVFFVFALDNDESFKRVEKWVHIVEKEKLDAKFYLIGNKVDLPNHTVTPRQILDFCSDHDNMEYVTASALDGTGVRQAFTALAKALTLQFVEEKTLDPTKANFVYRVPEVFKEAPAPQARACCGGTH
jgi:Ras-related protein Rab-1A